jgi:hypothetical protein
LGDFKQRNPVITGEGDKPGVVGYFVIGTDRHVVNVIIKPGLLMLGWVHFKLSQAMRQVSWVF